MKALTVIRPMDIALVDERIGKPVENREWQRSPGLQGAARALTGQRLAIHGGMKYDGRYRADIRRRTGVDVPASDTFPGHIVGVVTVAELSEWSPSDWYIPGNMALVVRNPVRLDIPVRCTGFQGFWTVPDEAFRQIQAQLLFKGVVV